MSVQHRLCDRNRGAALLLMVVLSIAFHQLGMVQTYSGDHDSSFQKSNANVSSIENSSDEPKTFSAENLTIAIHGITDLHNVVRGALGGTNSFCDLVTQRLHSLGISEGLIPGGLKGHLLPTRPLHRLLVDVSINCRRVFKRSSLGTGNYVVVLYGIRFAARRIGNMDVRYSCADAAKRRAELVLPWLMGFFPASDEATKRAESVATIQEVCEDFHRLPIHQMLPEIQLEFRRMALELVGTPDSHHPMNGFVQSLKSPDVQQKESFLAVQRSGDSPLFPDTELDDAVFHLRCGDILGKNYSTFGPFHKISNTISPRARTIGIITAPFQGQGRKRDSNKELRRRCEVLAYSLRDHLESKFPDAAVSIRNDSNETIALAYSRFILANQSIAGLSTFPIIPMYASFGSAYFEVDPATLERPLTHYLVSQSKHSNGTENKSVINFTAANMASLWSEGDAKVLEWFEQP